MAFEDLKSFFDPTLRLPINGKTYVIQPPDAATGLFCQRMMAGVATVVTGGALTDDEAEHMMLDDDDERVLYQRILGPVWDELAVDGVDWISIQHVGTTALVWIVNGDEAAEEQWASPKAPEPRQPEDRKPKQARPASKNSSRKRAAKPASAASPGPTSSPTGD